MTTTRYSRWLSLLTLTAVLLFGAGCERELDDLEPATFPTNPNVFIDAFSGGLNYAAFGGSDVTAFDVDTDVKYAGTTSMRFSVPDFEDPAGAYAGGTYFTEVGRDLSAYNVLTFWAKASQAATIDVIGFGNDLGENRYQTAINGVAVNTNWKQYYIPIPDPAKLTQERGLFFYSEGPENGQGYTFWIDEVKFENLGTIGEARPVIFNGEDRVVSAEAGTVINVESYVTFNLPTGIDQRVETTAAFFTFTSSDPSVATVNADGQISVLASGTATITARLGDTPAVGSLTVTSTGQANRPTTPAPTPTLAANEVISIYSNAYDDVPVDFYNGYWEFSTAETFEEEVAGDDLLRYINLNFVGIQFTTPTIDASNMTHFRMDVWTPNPTGPPANFKVLLVDFGSDNAFGGGDDSSHEITLTAPTLQSEQWFTIDVPLSAFAGLTSRQNLAQIVLSGDLTTIYVDNILLYRDGSGGGDEPTIGAPTPDAAPGDVISIFSDAYTNVPGSDLNPDWGQATIVSEVDINGNNTLLYSGLNYQGLQLDGTVDVSDMDFLHLDFWTANSTDLNVYLISPGPNEMAVSLNVPTAGWASIDIPLSDFSPVDLSNLIQLKFDGNGDIYLDNIYFFKDSGVGPTEPTTDAPEPTLDASNVISLFSGPYTDVPVDTWRTDWSAATLADVTVNGNPTKKYSELDFVGIETVNNQIDASAMTHFHLDVWSADFTFFAVKLVDFGADGAFGGGDDTEHQINFEMPAQGQWISYDIPLSDFTGLQSTMNIAQLILVGQPIGGTTVYVDNVYFHN